MNQRIALAIGSDDYLVLDVDLDRFRGLRRELRRIQQKRPAVEALQLSCDPVMGELLMWEYGAPWLWSYSGPNVTEDYDELPEWFAAPEEVAVSVRSPDHRSCFSTCIVTCGAVWWRIVTGAKVTISSEIPLLALLRLLRHKRGQARCSS